ncbi:MAG: hypothetical protein ACJAXN_001271 [Psychromonas sp.]
MLNSVILITGSGQLKNKPITVNITGVNIALPHLIVQSLLSHLILLRAYVFNSGKNEKELKSLKIHHAHFIAVNRGKP